MSVEELLSKMERDDLLDLKIISLNHLVNKEITLKKYLSDEAILNKELEKYKDQ